MQQSNNETMNPGSDGNSRCLIEPLRNLFRKNKIKSDSGEDAEDNASVELEEGKSRCAKLSETKMVIMILCFTSVGWLMNAIAMIFPEIVLVRRNRGIIEDHVGYFQTCSYNRITRMLTCRYIIIAEMGGAITMAFLSFLSGVLAILCAIRYLTSSYRSTIHRNQHKTFSRLRILSFISGITNACAMGALTYLYNSFLPPLLVSFILSWVASFLLLIGGAVGFCFQTQEIRSESSVAPISMQTSRVSWHERRPSEKVGGSGEPTVLTNTTSS